MKATYKDISFVDEDIVNLDDWLGTLTMSEKYHPKCYLFHDHGFTLCIVFADELQDALDIAADAGKLERYLVSEAESADYDSGRELDYLGNAGLPHDIESLGIEEVPVPKFSFASLLMNANLSTQRSS